MITPSRRGFLVGLGTGIALLSAPAIVRASSLMPVVKIPQHRWTRSLHAVSILRSELVLEIQVDGQPVDWTPLTINEVEVIADNGASIIVPVPREGARQSHLLRGLRWQ